MSEMIVKVEGEVINIKRGDNNRHVDVMCNSGVAYRVYLGMADNAIKFSLNSEISLFTSHQVREDSQTLYGFSTSEDRDFFEVLIGVSGVGPKTALNMLSLYTVSDVKQMILEGDHKGLSRAQGLGPKGAKKIILELAGILTIDTDDANSAQSSVLKDVKDAFRSLGFAGSELDQMLDSAETIMKENENIGIEGIIQSVLQGR